MVILENDYLHIGIEPKGAELQSLYGKQTGIEYLWQGDAAYWSKRSPVLFPIVGTLKDDTAWYKGQPIQLPRHGFARDMVFNIVVQTSYSAVFQLCHNADIQRTYPFAFCLYIHYTLHADELEIKYEVINSGNDSLLFSIGGHPAFNVPMARSSSYKDYYLQFERKETAPRWSLQRGLIADPLPFLEHEDCIRLSHELFYGDALVFKNLQSGSIALLSDKHEHGVAIYFGGFPYLGIWAQKDAPFVCIEPWQGIADSINTSQQFADKEGIITLERAGTWQAAWRIACF